VLDKDPNLTAIDESYGSLVLVTLLKAITKSCGVRPSEPACNLVILENLQYDLIAHGIDYDVENFCNFKGCNNRWLRTGELCVELQVFTWQVVVETSSTNTASASRHKLLSSDTRIEPNASMRFSQVS
jgi:hypothetical protein